ncbi:hypothetical protein JYU02_00710 [bacterium AH-315-P15]|nr:hypothetical protein [bacterium AH-315-P15]
MVEFVCDNQEIEDLLIKMHDLVTSNGGFVHEDLSICARGSNLTIEAPASVAAGDRLITVPKQLLLPSEKFDLRLDGDDICMGSPDGSLTSLQVTLMEQMLGLYNLTGKMAAHRQTSTSRLFLEDREFFDRVALPTICKRHESIPLKDFDLHTFMGTRHLGIKMNKADDVRTPSIMPIIDFFNNNSRSLGFNVDDNAVSIDMSAPIEGSNECFVRYGKYDAYSLLFGYDYVDPSVLFVASIPMTIELSGFGTLEIARNTSQERRREAPKTLSDLKSILPPIVPYPDENEVWLSYLIVPPPHMPRAMRRILAFAIELLSPSISRFDRNFYLNDAERQIIEGNLKFYSDLKGYIGSYECKPGLEAIVENVGRVADMQLEKIGNYSFDAAKKRSV